MNMDKKAHRPGPVMPCAARPVSLADPAGESAGKLAGESAGEPLGLPCAEGPEGEIRFVRPGDTRDAAAILAIYAPFVEKSPVTFEVAVPEVGAFTERIACIATAFPYLVHVREGKILAYAYASRHLERAAFAWDVQTSVYAAPACRGSGAPRALYTSLCTLLAELGYRNAYALITRPNPVSEAFHAALGFVPAGVHHKAGYKAGKWHDMAWMEKHLAPHEADPQPPRPVSVLAPAPCRALFARTLREFAAAAKKD